MENKELYDDLAVLLETGEGSIHGGLELEALENWNSLAVMSFMALADEKYGVTLSPRSLLECRTVEDLANLVLACSASK